MLRRTRDSGDTRDTNEGSVDARGASDADADVDEYDDTDTPSEPSAEDAGDEAEHGSDDEYYEVPPRDPVVGWMTLISVLLVLVVVVAAGAIVFFLLEMRGAPRTAVERQIIASEAAASAMPTEENFRNLGYAYLAAGRHREALSAVARGRKVKDGSIFDLLEGDILRMQGSYERAVKMYEKAAKRNEAEVKKEVEALAKRGIFSPVSRTTYVSIMIGKGEALVELGRPKEALAAFEDAVEHESTNAYALVRLGDLSAEVGRVEEAEKAYKEALRFIPDFKPALEGLDRIDDGVKE